jgi:hypothetical protein
LHHGAWASKWLVLASGALLIALSIATPAASGARPIPTPIGLGLRFHPPPGARPVHDLECRAETGDRYGVHLELFAKHLVVLVPAGIGVAPPRRRRGAYVVGGRCSYPARTVEPTGLIEIAASARLSLGQFFDLWGQPLSATSMAGFRCPPGKRVLAFVGGRAWHGDPRAIPLRRHAEIVLEVGGFISPHVSYRFPKGL